MKLRQEQKIQYWSLPKACQPMYHFASLSEIVRNGNDTPNNAFLFGGGRIRD